MIDSPFSSVSSHVLIDAKASCCIRLTTVGSNTDICMFFCEVVFSAVGFPQLCPVGTRELGFVFVVSAHTSVLVDFIHPSHTSHLIHASLNTNKPAFR